MTTLPFPCAIRPCEERDHAFVFGTWLESYKGAALSGTWLHMLPWPRYKRQQTEIIRAALRDGACMVACLPDDTDHLLGFACGRDGVLHYVHVRHERRRNGLGSALVQALDLRLLEASHMTAVGEHVARKFALALNPLSAMVP